MKERESLYSKETTLNKSKFEQASIWVIFLISWRDYDSATEVNNINNNKTHKAFIMILNSK